MYETEIIECIECSRPFPFTPRGKAYFEKMGFAKPKRCSGCRVRSRPNDTASIDSYVAS